MATKKTPKGKKSLSIKDMPPKPKGGAAVKGGFGDIKGETSEDKHKDWIS